MAATTASPSVPSNWKQVPLGRQRVAVVPLVQLGAPIFRQVVGPAFAPDGSGQGSTSLLSNELFSRFNAALDNQQGYRYLTPNARQLQPYADWPALRSKLLLGRRGLGAVLAGGWYGWRRRAQVAPRLLGTES